MYFSLWRTDDFLMMMDVLLKFGSIKVSEAVCRFVLYLICKEESTLIDKTGSYIYMVHLK